MQFLYFNDSTIIGSFPIIEIKDPKLVYYLFSFDMLATTTKRKERKYLNECEEDILQFKGDNRETITQKIISTLNISTIYWYKLGFSPYWSLKF